MTVWTDWDDLRFIVALGKSGSMSIAAKDLGASAATVSRKIRSANERFGQNIFQKDKDGWKLTNAGLPLYDLAKDFEKSLSALQNTEEENERQKPLLLTSLDFLIRAVLLPKFPLLRESNPFIELTLHSSNENLSLAYGEADIAVRMARPTSGRLVSRKLGEFTYSLYGVKGGDYTNWIGRAEHLDFVPEVMMAKQFFDKPPTIRVTDYKASLEAMMAMRVASVLPDVVARAVPGIIKIEESPMVRREAWLVIHEDRRTDKSIRAVIDWLDLCFKAHATE